MKKIFTALMIAVAVLFAANVQAQKSKGGKVIVIGDDSAAGENLVTKTYKFQNLMGVKAGSVFEVQVVKGRSGKITVQAPEATLEHIIVSEKAGVLQLRVENGYNISESKDRWFSKTKNLRGPIKVLAEIPSLSEIDLSGAAKFYTKDNFSEKSCKIDLSGAAKVRLAKLNADYLSLDMSGASELVIAGSYDKAKTDLSGASKLFLSGTISEKLSADLSGASLANVTGKTEHVDLDCSGAAQFKSKDLSTKELNIDLSGAAKVQLTVLKKISGEVSGAGSLVYYGDPDKVILEKSRGASVTHK